MKHKIRKWMNRPRPEDFLPYATNHQHKQTWRWPFLGLALALVVIVVLIMILVGQQAQFEEYVENNREHICELYELQQEDDGRDYSAYRELDCPRRR